MKNRKATLAIAILTVITATLWLIASAIKVSQTSTISPELQEAIEPLQPNIDGAIFERLEERSQ